MIDVSDTLAADSDQLDAVDLLGGDRVFTITNVRLRKNAEQPLEIDLAEFDRVWRPGKSMRRVLAGVWGKDASVWIGRKVQLYCDERVIFGGKPVGGTRIRAMSHIDKPIGVPLQVGQGKFATYPVKPLKEEPAPKSQPKGSQPDESVDETAARIEALRAEWEGADEARRAEIQAEVELLRGDDPLANVPDQPLTTGGE